MKNEEKEVDGTMLAAAAYAAAAGHSNSFVSFCFALL
jgi:hypothetical protein